MEAALVSGFIKTILPRILSLVEEKYKLKNRLKSDILFLERELRMITVTIDEQILLGGKNNHGAVLSLSMEELRELAHQMEDCIDRFLYHVTRGRQSASWLPRIIRSLKTMLSCQRLAAEVQLLKKVPEEVHQREERYKDLAAFSSSSRHVESSSSSSLSGSYPHTLKADLVGIDSPRDELVQQLAEEAEGLPKQLKVISIVGVHGSGKTVLAREVYDSDVGQRFSLRVWVSAADRGPREVLMGILQEIGMPVLDNSSIYQLVVDLCEHLKGKRYLIVIDDIQTDQWGTIEAAFQEQSNVSSRVMVTTTIQSVANSCSSSNGYVHKMRRLGDKHSEQLLEKKACQKKYLGYTRQESKEVLKKCDGNPLALVSVGQLLRKKGWPTDPSCEYVCRNLRNHMVKDETFEAMRRVLLKTFYSVEGHGPRLCLLYFGMFPRDHPIRSKSLMRRWLAEGFVEQQSSSSENFNTLIDRNIIEPILVSNNEQVRTCRTYGMMHEFILQMSTSQDIITLLSANMVGRKYVRRLSLHHSGATSLDIDLSLIRSLLVFGEAGKAVLNFQKYQLLKVLDLEQCTDLGDDHLKDICNLLLLRYLSLGVTVTSLPKDIEKLKLLETLDLRKTKVKMIPVEVFLLPCLVHLFGKKLQLSNNTKSIKKAFLEGKSNLETLSGFTTDGGQGFPQIMNHMMNLRKVKIWFEKSERNTDSSDLKDAIEKFIYDDKEECHDPRSLSLHFNDCSENILNLLKSPCYLRSLKLKGKFLELPQFVVSMRGLQELCISSTKLTAHLLAALSSLTGLQHLKLIADELEDFIIKDLAFPALLHLSIVLHSSNTLPRIEEGAMPYLTSLKLLCKDLVGLADIKIKYLRCLKEVILDATVTQETVRTWKKAAMEHPNWPKILLFNPVNGSESEPADGSVASTFTESETGEQFTTSEVTVQENDSCMLVRKRSSVVQKKMKMLAVQSNSNGEQNSSFAHMGYSEGSLDLTELSIPHNSKVPSYTCPHSIRESNASSC